MFKYNLSQLERYSKMIPKADYSSLEKFLRTVKDEDLNNLNSASINVRQGSAQPYEQLFLIIVLASIFINEYNQEEFNKNDYLKLFPVFTTSIFFEVVCRNKKINSRLDEWRELKPSQIEKYKVYEN